MPTQMIHECQYGPFRRDEAHVERERHYQIDVFLSRLDEDQRPPGLARHRLTRARIVPHPGFEATPPRRWFSVGLNVKIEGRR